MSLERSRNARLHESLSSARSIHRVMFSPLALLLALALSSLLVGCGDPGSDEGSGPSTGSVSIFITDAPSDEFDQILVTIDSLTLIGGGPQVDLWVGQRTIDLKDLEDFTDLFVVAHGVPARWYSKIRLGVTRIELVRNGDVPEVIPVKVPANGKIDLVPGGPFLVKGGITLVIEIDMDAKKSIHLIQTGNGKYVFRPVIFVTIDYTRSPSKLSRVHGVITEVFDETAFELCSSLVPTGTGVTNVMTDGTVIEGGTRVEFGGEEGLLTPGSGVATGSGFHCLTLEADANTGVFDPNGDPALVQDLMVGDEVTAVGRFHLIDGNHDGPVATPLGALGGHPDHFVHSDGAYPLAYEAGSSDPSAASTDDRSGRPRTYIGGPFNTMTDLQIIFVAAVIEMGPRGTFLQLKGTIDSGLDVADEFDFALDPGQGFGDATTVRSLLQQGTRIFSRSGAELDEQEILADTRAKIDGVFGPSAGALIYKTALLILDIDGVSIQELNGVIASVDQVQRRLDLDIQTGGGIVQQCVDVPTEAMVFLVEETSGGTTSMKGSLADLKPGMSADAYGQFMVGQKCFVADSVIAFFGQ